MCCVCECIYRLDLPGHSFPHKNDSNANVFAHTAQGAPHTSCVLHF